MPVKKELIYPIFLESMAITENPFWQMIFEELAYGKAPYGTYINKGFLCCSYKGKEFTYKIERKDPKVLYDDIYSLLTEKVGILSQKDKIKQKMLFHEIEKKIKESKQQWNTIRRKNIKDVLYENFVVEQKKKYNLSIKEARYLFSLIIIGMAFKIILSKDVNFENDKIQSINGIEFEEGKVIFQKSLLTSYSDLQSGKDGDEKGAMHTNWEKFLKMIKDSYS